MTAAYEFDYPPSSPRELAFREENFQENAPRDFSKRSFSSAFSNEGKLPENDGKKKKRDAAVATDDSEESDSGEEGISIEELKKTTGWKLLMKNLNKHFKPKDFDSQ
ncbi:uncharacterized protein [Pocillopora verrucosa]|uniref:uncharacterized protein n=1 Tax=Pocillopora verrucosa TaxID=203993 RepID=UPI002797B5B5|nr:uncharacterized protein LOC131793907 [Pocillopora verrucosa]